MMIKLLFIIFVTSFFTNTMTMAESVKDRLETIELSCSTHNKRPARVCVAYYDDVGEEVIYAALEYVEGDEEGTYHYPQYSSLTRVTRNSFRFLREGELLKCKLSLYNNCVIDKSYPVFKMFLND